MLPSLVEKDIEDGIRSFIEREFPIATPGFKSGFEHDKSVVDVFLEKRENFIKGPWLEIRRPFRKSTDNMQEVLPLLSGRCGIGLKPTPYQHQLESFRRLCMPDPKSTIVATGTGSGKTECFLYPVLDYVLQALQRKQKGIKALIIYPMNALATDQSRRLVKLCYAINRKTGILPSVGLITAAPGEKSPVMDEQRGLCITDRDKLRRNPPDILLTNYKMLDYLLIREKDRSLWKATSKDSLRYLIVDELHTFDGAQGTDLACLIRRLRNLLNLGDELACVGTSATLGGENGLSDLQKYATDVFGADFSDPACIIREDRLSAGEYLDGFGDRRAEGVWPSKEAVDNLKRLPRDVDPQRYISASIRAWFPREIVTIDNHDYYWKTTALKLGTLLPHLEAFQRLMSAEESILNVAELADEWKSRVGALKKFSHDDVVILIRSLAALISMARQPIEGDNEKTLPFLNVRVQMWMRELANMVATVERKPRLMPAADHDPKECLALPVVTCRDCNATAWGAVEEQNKVSASLQAFYSAWFSKDSTTSLFYPIAENNFDEAVKNSPKEIYVFCQNAKEVRWIGVGKTAQEVYHGPCPICGKEHEFVVVRKPDMVRTSSGHAGVANQMSASCPYCGTPNSMRVIGARSVTLSAATVGHLNSSTSNDDPKLITFSDSVQDAAHRSGFLEARSYSFTVRQALAGYIRKMNDPTENLADLLRRAPAYWKTELGGMKDLVKIKHPLIEKNAQTIADARFVTTFLPTDMMWRRTWLNFVTWASGEGAAKWGQSHSMTGKPEIDRLAFFDDLFRRGDTERNKKEWQSFCRNVEARLSWEMFIELTLRSHSGRTLEISNIGSLSPSRERIAKAVELFKEKVAGQCPEVSQADPKKIEQFIVGFLIHEKSRGCFDLSGVEGLEDFMQFVKTGNDFHWINQSFVLPTYGKKFRPPAPLTMRRPSIYAKKSNCFFDIVMPSATGVNWYSLWLGTCFFNEQLLNPATESIYQGLFDALGESGLMKTVWMTTPDQTPAYLLDPTGWTVRRGLKKAVCVRCGRWHIIPEDEYAFWAAMPCLSQGCFGTSHRIEAAPEAKGLYLGEPTRTTAKEHTANVESEERGRIEKSFSEGKEPWDVNLLSATPTLEMGIDIGDLSTVLLASMPPRQANYLQRIGRAGRRDGNALAMTVCGNNPHAQYFWSDPEKMLAGAVEAPGVFLHAMAVIERQLMAFAVTRWMSQTEGAQIPKEIGPVLDRFSRDKYEPGDFPQGFLDYVSDRAEPLVWDFAEGFSDPATKKSMFTPEEKDKLRNFLMGDASHGLTSLRGRLIDKLMTLADEREAAKVKIREFRNAAKRREKDPQDEARDADIAEIQATVGSLLELVKSEYTEKDTLQILTDEGLLPNYAFPEEGIKVDGVVMKVRTREAVKAEEAAGLTAEQREKRGAYKRFQFQRAASSGLLEVAPNSTFYVNDFALHIDQVELRDGKVDKWRFCPKCQHAVPEYQASGSCCPRCGDPEWAAGQQVRSVLRMKTVYAWADIRKDRISDDIEERKGNFASRRMLIDIPTEAIRTSFVSNKGGEGFGFEYISAVTLRDFNFGTKDSSGQTHELTVAGSEIDAPGFTVCDCCGRLRNEHAGNSLRAQHDYNCKYWSNPAKERWIDGLLLYREFTSEAIRIRVPGGMLAQENSPDMITASLSAALRLGLRKYYRGSVDHLRIVETAQPRDGQPPQHYIIVHDTVPGGTGYLKELMTDPNNLMRVFELALDAMASCVCSTDPTADGCYQCLYQHQDERNRARISKQCASRVVSFILDQKKSMASGSIDRDDPTLIDSQLEADFIRALRNDHTLVAEFKECRSGGNRPYYLVKMRSGRIWRMDLQIDFTGSRPSRPDFVFRSAHENEKDRSKTMAVFLDGWQFHAPIVEDDTAKRQSLLNMGYRVWTLGWHDIPRENEETRPAPILPYQIRTGGKIAKTYDTKLKPFFEKQFSSAYPTFSEVMEKWGDDQNNFSRLLEWLNDPDEAAKACRVMTFSLAMSTFFDEAEQPRKPLRAPEKIEKALYGLRPGKGVALRSSANGVYQTIWTLSAPFRAALFADGTLCNAKKAESASGIVPAELVSFWASANIIQFAGPTLLVPYVPFSSDVSALSQNPWAEALDILSDTGDAAEVHVGAETPVSDQTEEASQKRESWDDLLDLLPDSMEKLIEKLFAMDLPKPEAGIDYADPKTGEIIETFDLWWPDANIAVIAGEEDSRKAGVVTVYPAEIDPNVIAEAVRTALNK